MTAAKLRPPCEIFADVYGREPDTAGDEYRCFCLALYCASTRRNKNASPAHIEKIKAKNPQVLKMIEDIKNHARIHQQSQNANTTVRRYR